MTPTAETLTPGPPTAIQWTLTPALGERLSTQASSPSRSGSSQAQV